MSSVRYENSFKLQLVQLVNTGQLHNSVPKQYKVFPSTLYSWIHKCNGTSKPTGKKALTDEQKQFLTSEKQVKRVSLESDMLKEAALIFAEKQLLLVLRNSTIMFKVLGVTRSYIYKKNEFS